MTRRRLLWVRHKATCDWSVIEKRERGRLHDVGVKVVLLKQKVDLSAVCFSFPLLAYVVFC